MPRYDYECRTCHHLFELKQSFDSEPVATCPECGDDARRKFSVVPVVFKGSGFYVNDYGRGSNGSMPNKADKTSTEAKKSQKSEAKSENKSDSAANNKTKVNASSSKEKGD